MNKKNSQYSSTDNQSIKSYIQTIHNNLSESIPNIAIN